MTAEVLDGKPSFEEWCKVREASIPQYQFWKPILQMELTIFTLIRSFREGDFELYCHALHGLLPYFFCQQQR